jgi:hypothetical protein
MRTRPCIVARFAAVATLVLAGALVGCTQGKRPFLIVQLCFKDDQELADFTRLVESIAYSEGMVYVDNSGPTERGLAALNAPGRLAPVINIGVHDDDGVGLGVGNLGLPKWQVAVGFSEGSKPAEARRFADAVAGQLRARWHVEAVPEGRGALPIQNCLAHAGT